MAATQILRFGMWNTRKKDVADLVARLARVQKLDVIVLLELGVPVTRLLKALATATGSLWDTPWNVESERVTLLTRFPKGPLEHGELESARGRLEFLERRVVGFGRRGFSPPDEVREARADVFMLGGDIRPAIDELIRIRAPGRNLRARASLALLLLAHGDTAGGLAILEPLEHEPPRTLVQPSQWAANRRLSACIAHTRGIFALAKGDATEALAAFTAAEQHCERWGEHGHDRRSFHRARAASRLGVVRALDLMGTISEEAVVRTRELIAWTEVLNRPDSVDRVSTVLGVDAHLHMAHLLAELGDKSGAVAEARKAVELAAPLVDHEVPSWAALAKHASAVVDDLLKRGD